MLHKVLQIARKEVASYFSSPVAFIFLGTFLAVALFVFFWVEKFFARNIADVRPLFEWMPVLLIFLVAALTMRMWSDERRIGTVEFLLTQPIAPLQLVLGKFSACMVLVGIALLLTLPVPVTVALLGNLDWGPVFGAYVATLFLAAAYTSIGLTVSARSDSQIVSLIVTVLVCSLFYVLGSDTLTSLVGNRAGEMFKLLGSGSRFASITRGVVDVRDLYYYLSIMGVFISLNVFFLESSGWSQGVENAHHRRWRVVTALFVLNFVAGNVWLQPIGWARADVTQGRIYSISDATRGYLERIEEPLLIRGYFSSKTHPLLAPLVPRLRDLIREFEVAGRGNVRAEFIDPLEHPDLEREAGEKYGIKPVPFQVADKYQAALVNSYFNVLVQYGDQFEVLGFRDLIEVKSPNEMELDVELRNPEYDITRTIKKVLYGYQSSGDLFAGIDKPVVFTGYISEDAKLPGTLRTFKRDLEALLTELKQSANGKFDYKFIDPGAEQGAVAAKIAEEYGFRPMRASLLDANTFYFYMILTSDTQVVQVPLPEDLQKEALRRSIDAALKRFSSGFLKTVALYSPPPTPPDPEMAQMRMPSGKQFRLLEETLQQEHQVEDADLHNGIVPEEADILVMVAPDKLSEKQLFGVDQFLMKGGTVILSSSGYEVTMGQAALNASRYDSGLAEWLGHYGIQIGQSMVLDPQNAMLPIPINRNLGGFTVQEIRMVEYPYFVDIRSDGMGDVSGMLSAIPQVMINWSSPITVDAQKNKERKVVRLLHSSPQSWTSDSTDVLPDFRQYGALGFQPSDKREAQVLAVSVEGEFTSFFKDKNNPLLETPPKAADDKEENAEDPSEKNEDAPVISGVIEKSPQSARIILFASNEFLTDQTLNLAASAGGTIYLNSLQLLENAIDWSLEDRGLLSIRSRGHFSRTLRPLSSDAQKVWEYLNYFLGLAGLLAVYGVYRYTRAKAQRHYAEVLAVRGA